MTPAASRNIPNALKASCSSWPLYSVSFTEMLELVERSQGAQVLAGRFTRDCHTAYLAETAAQTLYRCVQADPMKVKLRRAMQTNPRVELLKTGAAA